MKIAFLLTGNIRTWERNNIFSFVDMEVDYYISTTNKKYNYHPFISNKFRYDDINDDIISNDDINKIFNFDYKHLLISDDDIINNETLSPNMRNIDSCYHQYNRIQKILQVVKNYEEENNFKYDIIIKSRLDVEYYTKLSTLINFNNNVYTSKDNVQPNDITIISKRDDMFNIINYMMGEFYNQTDSNSHHTPPHGLLESALKKHNLTYIPKNISKEVRL